MTNIYNISPATPQDIPALTRVINSAYQGEPGSRSWTSEGHLVAGQRTTEENLRGLFDLPAVTMFKCTDPTGELLGCVLLEQKNDTLYLGMLSVSPRLQASGIGGMLLKQGEVFAREHSYASITITVIDQRSELIDWYRRKGFVSTGKLEPFRNESSSAMTPVVFMEMRKELS